MNRLLKLLIACKILDDDNTVSLSSLLMIVLIVKVALTTALDWPTLSALFVTLLGYNGKKLIRMKSNDNTAQVDDALKATLDAHAAQITHVTSQVSKLLSASSVNSVMDQMLGR